VLPGGPHAFARTHGDPNYRIRASKTRPRRAGLFVPMSLSDEYDLVDTQGSFQVDDHGKPYMENVSLLAIKSEKLQDRVASLRQSLESAAGQFSGDKSAIIHADVTTSFTELVRDAHLPRSQSVLEEFLRNNTKISAVILDRDQFVTADERVTLSRASETIVNGNARNPLAEFFRAGMGPKDAFGRRTCAAAPPRRYAVGGLSVDEVAEVGRSPAAPGATWWACSGRRVQPGKWHRSPSWPLAWPVRRWRDAGAAQVVPMPVRRSFSSPPGRRPGPPRRPMPRRPSAAVRQALSVSAQLLGTLSPRRAPAAHPGRRSPSALTGQLTGLCALHARPGRGAARG
jgi:hypothetical protein